MTQDIRVLVGDDDVNDRFFLEWGFKETCPDVKVEFARTGEEVIDYLEDGSRPKPALLIIDSMMPRRDGFSVLQWVRGKDEFKQLPIIMLSGQPYEKNENRARDLGASEYVGKPHDLEQLKTLVKNWRRQYIDPIRQSSSRPSAQKQFHLLIGDSSPSFRIIVQRVTAEACPAAAVTLFRNRVELFKYFEASLQPDPSLLLLDLGTASIEALRWLRLERQLTELPIIIWTSTPVRVEEELAHEFGVTEYLKKPNTFPALLQSIYDLAHRYGAIG